MPITPHPETRDLKPLPVPERTGTLEAYSHALEAVLDDEELRRAKEITADFGVSTGPRLDEALRERASQREANGTNWLSDEWYAGYLSNRGSLPLTTNVGFQLNLPSEASGEDRVVERIQRVLAVHLQAASGDLPEYVDARGNRITQDQWFVFAGGLRHPQPEQDDVLQAQGGAANREIGVFVGGRLFALQVTDNNAAPISAAALSRGLEAVLNEGSSASKLDFNAPSLLGSGELDELLPALLAQGDNQAVYARLRDMLFTIDLIDVDGGAQDTNAERTECLRADTPEAAEFARKLAVGAAEQSDLEAAVNAHRAWVKRCKSGSGFDRHIQMMASIDDSHPFFHDPVATAVRTDCLSTTSIGGAEQVVRYCFAPAVPEGFGIAYTPLTADGELCVSWNGSTAERPTEFIVNLTEAGALLWQFCAGLSKDA